MQSLFLTFHGTTMDIIQNSPDKLYLIVGNFYHEIRNTYNTQSFIYQWSNGQFKLYGIIDTIGVVQVKFFKIHSDLFVGVANKHGACMLFIHDENASGRFREHQSFGVTCQSMSVFKQDNDS